MPDLEVRAVILSVGLLLDAVFGEPRWLWSHVSHPAILFGRAISWLEHHLLRASDDAAVKKRKGILLATLLILIVGGLGLALSSFLRLLPYGFVFECIFVGILLAQRSLYEHVTTVAYALNSEGLAGGRKAVSLIVGRDPNSLDEAGVSRAAIESLAENFSDGCVAPAFWYLVGGLPGLFVYKAINTADSMVGYRNDKYLHFGWASARLDDVLNFIPARLAGFIIATVAAFTKRGGGSVFKLMWRDARKHASPNAGWPETAMAAALGLALGGPRRYGDQVTDDPWLNGAGRQEAKPSDIEEALWVFVLSCLFLLLLAGAFAGASSIL